MGETGKKAGHASVLPTALLVHRWLWEVAFQESLLVSFYAEIEK